MAASKRPLDDETVRHRLAALLLAFVGACVVVAASFVFLPAQSAHDPQVDYGYVYSGAKASSVEFVRSNLSDDSLLMLGSSEFSTPASSVPQIPATTFGANNFGLRAMCVGEAFDQCLWDTIALGALADGGLPRSKVVLTVGLGQFTDGGMDSSTFGTRFSYSLYSRFCDNPAIPSSSREYVRNRLRELGVDETSLRSVESNGPIELVNRVVLSGMDDLRLRSDLRNVRRRGIPFAEGPVQTPNWDALRQEALNDAMRMSTSNDWGAEDRFWSEQLQPALEGLEGARAGETYSDTPEYDDLDCFLTVCDACGLEALVVISPSMGPYYDYIGISQPTRAAAYERIRNVVAQHGRAQLADFSDREYEKYFLFDIVHFGWTGWIDVEHAIYDFAMR